jgi:Vam6/Vps39-like protein vacuolar protein sorting-associated protein 39
VSAAQGVLKRHSDRIDATKALELLPLTTKVSEIHEFLVAVMRKRYARRRQGQILMNLLKSERLQAHEELLRYHAKRVTIGDETLCPVCRKPMRNTAFYCYPNGTVVHQGCATSVDECPTPDSGLNSRSTNYMGGSSAGDGGYGYESSRISDY